MVRTHWYLHQRKAERDFWWNWLDRLQLFPSIDLDLKRENIRLVILEVMPKYLLKGVQHLWHFFRKRSKPPVQFR